MDIKPVNRPLKIKRKTREEEMRDQCIGMIITVTVLTVVILGSGLVINCFLNSPSATKRVNSTSELRAVMVDHLSLTSPNQTFVHTATDILNEAGYTVDYVKGEEVTVELYRSLPTHDYKIVILRVHSTTTVSSGSAYVRGSLSLFTSEAVNTRKYIYEQLTEQLNRVFYLPYSEGNMSYFGIKPNFVRNGMDGRFEDTVVTGCEGLMNSDIAEAFLSRGASVCIGWNGSVTAAHTDSSTVRLLRLLLQGEAIDRGTTLTTQDVGLDPRFKSQLTYYPLTARDYVVMENKRH